MTGAMLSDPWVTGFANSREAPAHTESHDQVEFIDLLQDDSPLHDQLSGAYR